MGIVIDPPSVQPIFVAPGTRPQETPVDALSTGRPVLFVAPFGRRLVGRLLDICAVLTSFFLIFNAGLLPSRLIWDISDQMIVVLMVAMFAGITVSFVVLRIGLIAWWGCTAGQRIAGLRVVRHPEGTPARGWRLALKRWFVMRGRSSLGPLDDLWSIVNDPQLRRCDHDRRAGTVVVLAAPPPTPFSPPGGAGEPAGRLGRIVPGVALGLAVLATAAVFAFPTTRAFYTGEPEPPFAVNTFYDDHRRFAVRSPTGRTGMFERTAGTVLDGEKGCLRAAVDDRVRALLRELKCTGQIETAFKTPDNVVLASGHLLKFADPVAAARAEGRLRWNDLRFVPGGPVDPPGKVRGGSLDGQGRYVVVTSVVAARGPGNQERARNSLILLHTPTVNTILFL